MDYWEECIESAFNEAGITATQEQIKSVAADVAVSHENYGMAFGYDCIPNPLLSEMQKLKQEIKQNKEKQEAQLYGIKKGVAERRRIDVSDVCIDDDGLVTYYPR